MPEAPSSSSSIVVTSACEVGRELVDRVLRLLTRLGVGLAEPFEIGANVSVALFASSTAVVSESSEMSPLLIGSTIDVIDAVHVLIAEQRPSAHSVVGDVSLEAAVARAAAAGSEEGDAGDGRGEEGALGEKEGRHGTRLRHLARSVRHPIRRAAEATRHTFARAPTSGRSLTPERVREWRLYRPNSALTRPTSTAVFSAA